MSTKIIRKTLLVLVMLCLTSIIAYCYEGEQIRLQAEDAVYLNSDGTEVEPQKKLTDKYYCDGQIVVSGFAKGAKRIEFNNNDNEGQKIIQSGMYRVSIKGVVLGSVDRQMKLYVDDTFLGNIDLSLYSGDYEQCISGYYTEIFIPDADKIIFEFDQVRTSCIDYFLFEKSETINLSPSMGAMVKHFEKGEEVKQYTTNLFEKMPDGSMKILGGNNRQIVYSKNAVPCGEYDLSVFGYTKYDGSRVVSLYNVKDDGTEELLLSYVPVASGTNYKVSAPVKVNIPKDNKLKFVFRKETGHESDNEYNRVVINSFMFSKSRSNIRLFKNGLELTDLDSGDIHIYANTYGIEKGATVVAAMYKDNVLYKFKPSKETGIATEFVFDSVEIEDGSEYKIRTIFLRDLITIMPIKTSDTYVKYSLPETDISNVYVSVDANSSIADGTRARPFSTIEDARDYVRTLIPDQQSDITVNILPGMYNVSDTIIFDERDSGKNGYSVIWKGTDPDNQPVISGGTKITGWQEDANTGIWTAYADGVADTRTMYIDDAPAKRARSRYKYLAIGGTDFYDEDGNKIGFKVLNAQFENLSKPENAELVWDLKWTAQRTPVSGVVKNSTLSQYRFEAENASIIDRTNNGDAKTNPANGVPISLTSNSQCSANKLASYSFDRFENGLEFVYRNKNSDDQNLLTGGTYKIRAVGGRVSQSDRYLSLYCDGELITSQIKLPKIEYVDDSPVCQVGEDTVVTIPDGVGTIKLVQADNMSLYIDYFEFIKIDDDLLEASEVYMDMPYWSWTNGAGLPDNTRPMTTKEFYIENDINLLDEPGEFYFDKDTKIISYIPRDDEDMTTADVYAGTKDILMKVEGTSADSKVSNIKFDTITFKYGSANEVNTVGYVTYQADKMYSEDTLTKRGQDGGRIIPSQLTVNYADNIEINNCRFVALGSGAISMIEAVTNSKINGNVFLDNSATSIIIDSWDHKNNDAGNTNRCRNIEITNNIIKRAAWEYRGGCAISVYYADSVKILHNDISDLPYTGITLGWGWGNSDVSECRNHEIAYNKISNVTSVTEDGGHIYTLGNMPGTLIHHNYLYLSGDTRGGVYLDQGSQHISIYNNVVDSCNKYWFHLNVQGTYPTINNEVYNNYYSEGTYSRGEDTGCTVFEGNVSQSTWGEEANEIINNSGLEAQYEKNHVFANSITASNYFIDIPKLLK